MSCSELAAAEPLAGTAMRADRVLLLEHRGAWARDVAETVLPEELGALADGFDGRVLLIRRPDRAGGPPVAFVARVTEEGGELRSLATATLDDGSEPVAGPLLLVCTHGRRDPCCRRLGTPVYEALRAHVERERLWRSSHHGGHRFAANVLVLPAGIQLGRIGGRDAPRVAALVAAGRIPLEQYRGRTLYAPPVQAAEVAVRRELGLDRVADVRLVAADEGSVRFATPRGEALIVVTDSDGPPTPPSCGADPQPTRRYGTRLESLA